MKVRDITIGKVFYHSGHRCTYMVIKYPLGHYFPRGYVNIHTGICYDYEEDFDFLDHFISENDFVAYL